MASEAKLRLYKNNLSYVIPKGEVPDFASDIGDASKTNRIERDGEDYHITIIAKSESHIPPDKIEYITDHYEWNKYAIIGQGSTSKGDAKAHYYIVWYPAGNKLRELMKLPPKDFHITIGFDNSDIHDTDKGVNTLIALNPKLIEDVESIIDKIEDDQKQILIGLLLQHADENNDSKDNLKLRLKLHYSLKQYEDCMDILKTLEETPEYNDDQNYIHTSRAFIYFKMGQPYNGRSELLRVPEEERSKGWLGLYTDFKYRIAGKADTRKKVYIHIGNEEIQLSRNFSWLIPHKLAGISVPRSADEIRAFEYMGIGLVVTVMEEQKLPEDWFENTTVENIYYAVPNYGTPTLEEMREIIKQIEMVIESGKAVVVHCGGGKGRAGTVLSCFIAKNGFDGKICPYPQMNAIQAIQFIREFRPGSVETSQQEKFISEYVNNLYKQ
jgi:atypical dual specificity phosphatase